jgi:hypothetical protein
VPILSIEPAPRQRLGALFLGGDGVYSTSKTMDDITTAFEIACSPKNPTYQTRRAQWLHGVDNVAISLSCREACDAVRRMESLTLYMGQCRTALSTLNYMATKHRLRARVRHLVFTPQYFPTQLAARFRQMFSGVRSVALLGTTCIGALSATVKDGRTTIINLFLSPEGFRFVAKALHEDASPASGLPSNKHWDSAGSARSAQREFERYIGIRNKFIKAWGSDIDVRLVEPGLRRANTEDPFQLGGG